MSGKGKRGKKKPLTLTLSPAETLRVACFPAGVHLFPKAIVYFLSWKSLIPVILAM
ncbi:hypothetical protein FDUTEX481_07667 [Tolypothrix sp. PCC 7601]|nr:hypothetical protein FDUTEX481_07667 [Tolypothrix sp. PCC 7601]